MARNLILTRRFSKYSINKISKNVEKSSAIITEMSPLIRAKCSQKAGMTCCSDLAILLYYEITRLGFDYNRIDIVFVRYFSDSLKEGTRKRRDTGAMSMFDDDTDIPQDMIENFIRNSQNKKI